MYGAALRCMLRPRVATSPSSASSWALAAPSTAATPGTRRRCTSPRASAPRTSATCCSPTAHPSMPSAPRTGRRWSWPPTPATGPPASCCSAAAPAPRAWPRRTCRGCCSPCCARRAMPSCRTTSPATRRCRRRCASGTESPRAATRVLRDQPAPRASPRVHRAAPRYFRPRVTQGSHAEERPLQECTAAAFKKGERKGAGLWRAARPPRSGHRRRGAQSCRGHGAACC
mmetsp:Transcript_19131/g.49071  ORF Transcript_19131/g.49071 Transcript_19131/m.49071 type:complete len:229 (-) Transcript_19131:105-791(-)